MYKREATEYDMNYVKQYGEDLNTILIFVCCSSSILFNRLTRSYRRVCSLSLAPLSSSMHIQTSNPI